MPYDLNSEFEPWRQTARGISAALMQLPALKAQASEGRMRGGLYQAQAGKVAAETAKVQAETSRLKSAPTDEDAFGDAMAKFIEARQTGGDQTGAATNLVQKFGRYAAKRPQDALNGMGRVLAILQATPGDDTANFAANTGRPVPVAAAVTDAQREASLSKRLEQEQIRADRPIALADDRMLVSTGGKVLNPGVHNVGIGERLFTGVPDLSYDLAAEGRAGRQAWSATPGSAIIDAGGNLINRIPSSSNPAKDADLGTQTKLRALGTALAESFKYNPKASTNILQQIDLLAPRPAPAPAANRPAVQPEAVRAEAMAAIAGGEDPAAVRQRFRELTGQDL